MTLDLFDEPWVRFVTSGSLLACRHVTELLSHRAPNPVAPPRWSRIVVIAALLGFYGLIRPTGGALLGGTGNIAGIAATLVSIVLLASAGAHSMAPRALFYFALPIAVGVPWGLLALTLPAWVSLAAAERVRGDARRAWRLSERQGDSVDS